MARVPIKKTFKETSLASYNAISKSNIHLKVICKGNVHIFQCSWRYVMLSWFKFKKPEKIIYFLTLQFLIVSELVAGGSVKFLKVHKICYFYVKTL